MTAFMQSMQTTEAMGDMVVRGLTDDDSFRVMVAVTTDSVKQVIDLQKPPFGQVEALGCLLTGAVLVRETMSPSERVQAIIRGADNRGTLVADSHPDGTIRGLCNLPDDMDSIAWKPGAVMAIMRSLPRGQTHQGVVSLENTSSVSQALMVYMHESEQVRTMIDVACSISAGHIVAAGGYVVQLLPELSDAKLAIMTERLASFSSMRELLHQGQRPVEIMQELLYGMPYSLLEQTPVRFECKCSEYRLLASMGSLRQQDLQELAASTEPIEVECDFCHKHYVIAPSQLRTLLTPS